MICDASVTDLLIIYKLPDARSLGLCIVSKALIPVLRDSLASWHKNQFVSQLNSHWEKNASIYFVTLRRVFFVNTKKFRLGYD